MNIYWFELRANRRSTLGWTLALAMLAVFFLAMFPTFANEAEQFKQVLGTMPEVVLKAVGVQIDSIASMLGFYSYIFLYISLCGAIQAMGLGLSILSKETREKTADFLLTKPVQRGAVVTAKLLAALTCLLITNAVFVAVASLMASVVKTDDYSVEAFLLVSATLPMIQLIFLALGLAAAMIAPRIRTVLPITLGTVFAFFAIGMIGATAEDGALRYLSPLHYFDRAYIVSQESYETGFLLLSGVIVAVAVAFAYWRYSRRDVHVN
ncbi:ABC transporter permease subunit [Paenibacillus chungangensis]|uniref:ABC transporter permease subunit n=1 Tax=Paenibacillus chungangensis TaxID=696535 RepID=A0ABW3HNW2_9BACL